MFMKKAVLESSMNLVISVIIITFIISVGFLEINSFIENRNNQLFNSGVNELINGIDYLIESNARGSFTQVDILLPSNESLTFDNYTNTLNNISVNANILDYLIISESGNYEITLCYACNATKEYLVIFN